MYTLENNSIRKQQNKQKFYFLQCTVATNSVSKLIRNVGWYCSSRTAARSQQKTLSAGLVERIASSWHFVLRPIGQYYAATNTCGDKRHNSSQKQTCCNTIHCWTIHDNLKSALDSRAALEYQRLHSASCLKRLTETTSSVLSSRWNAMGYERKKTIKWNVWFCNTRAEWPEREWRMSQDLWLSDWCRLQSACCAANIWHKNILNIVGVCHSVIILVQRGFQDVDFFGTRRRRRRVV
jgi:hypothetical protein